ncbi:TlpA disulfide reductase family protein [Flavobacterium rakeshii]|uniref:TlpA disulfide reductase family protein n=1 Tax=Flavobacterium rakeshii TaxID=1038845 RepID=UPI002E7C37D9|nr:TlpA disulfide reductase family protein [Flavobacterium rakeshii]MEE1900126.1 TlpA disulfide reductase family protein [Flavobacterium rakeshii]
MKKILVITLTVLAIMSFKGIDLAGNEFKIVGTVSTDFNGQKVYLAKTINEEVMDKLDSTTVKNGKFTFSGVADKPEQRLIYFEDKLMDGQIALYTEKGNITVNVNSEDIPKSVVGGTLNNNALAKLNVILIEVGKKEQAFKDEHMDNFNKAKSEGDVETQNRIVNEYSKLTKEYNKKYIAFIKENPNSLICAELFPIILKDQDAKAKDLKPVYDKMGPEPKSTQMGQKVEEYLNQMLASEKAMEATEIGKTAPDFSAATPNGKTLSLNQAKGKVTIIDFWASWCGPCRKENPNVVAMYNELHDKGLNIIGVSLDKDDAKWKGAIEKDNLTWQHISNLQGWDEPIAVQYGVTSIPATVILDKNGVIVARNLRGEELKAKVKELLAE